MSSNIQFIQITPEKLVTLINEGIQNQVQDLIKSFPQNNIREILTPEEVCDLLSIHDSTLWHWRNDGKVIAYGIAGRRYYKRSEIIESLVPMTPTRRTKLKRAA